MLALGDQVKVTGGAHPWHGAIAHLVAENWGGNLGYWEIELETILPGQRAMAHESEVTRL